MEKLKLSIDQLKNYLGTGLKVRIIRKGTFNNSPDEITLEEFGIKNWDIAFNTKRYMVKESKPLFYSLSDLDKFIPELGFVPAQELYKGLVNPESRIEDMMKWPLIMPFAQVQKLFEWNFWVFDQEYFTQAFIIDKLNNKNP